MNDAIARAFHESNQGPGHVPVPVSVSSRELVALNLPPLKQILSPWLSQKCLAMVHSKRGVGKTHFALAVAYAVASGGEYLGWKSPSSAPVLFLDGEMPAQLMQQRLSGQESDLLRVITPDLQEAPMPDLATLGGQEVVNKLIDTFDSQLIIVDNISCLMRSGGAENDAESWGIVSDWGLAHRRAGRSIVFLHHSGKGGTQRGTSKREDLLDVIIGLRRPVDYQDEDGCVFEIHFEKARSLLGDDVAPMEAKLERMPDGVLQWTWRRVNTVKNEATCALWNGGCLTVIDIAKELGINKSTAHRHLEVAMEQGLLTRPYPSQSSNKKRVAHATK